MTPVYIIHIDPLEARMRDFPKFNGNFNDMQLKKQKKK